MLMFGPYLGAMLFALGLLLNLEPTASLIRHIATDGLDEGWATLVGAVIGLSAIAWQTRRGFSHLISSQKSQANIDQQARLDQAEIEREQHEWQQRREAEQLSAALRGALLANRQAAINAKLHSMLMSKIAEDRARKDPDGEGKIVFKFNFDTAIFDANITRIGLLGADLVADVSQVFSELRIPNVPNFDVPVKFSMQKLAHDAVIEGLSDIIEDTAHVAQRLIAFELDKEDDDPGPLAKIKMSRLRKSQ